jgi:transcription elongation factor GreA
MERPKFKRNTGDEPTAVLTPDAYDRLRAELERLTTEGRTFIAERLQHARELGDIRENAEFDSAKNEQGLMEARIRELQRMLKDPDIVEGPSATDQAGPGVLVTVKPADEDDEETYLLSASKEERLQGVRTVTMDSPLGSALAGRRVGDLISYEAPAGTFSCEIVRLEPRA